MFCKSQAFVFSLFRDLHGYVISYDRVFESSTGTFALVAYTR